MQPSNEPTPTHTEENQPSTRTSETPLRAAEEDFLQAVKQVEAAIQRFILGDPRPYQSCWSHAEDVTIFGAWGAYEQGWKQVGPRLEWAAARFRTGHLTFERLAMGRRLDLAYTVWIEQGQVQVAGQEEVYPMTLRVTHLYRSEEGGWKLIHRHADAIIDKIEAAAVLQPQ